MVRSGMLKLAIVSKSRFTLVRKRISTFPNKFHFYVKGF